MAKLTLESFKKQLSEARKRGEVIPYIRGPIPFEWVSQACKLGGKCAHLSCVLWYAHGMGENPVVLTRRLWGQFGMTRHSAYYALKLMETAGLVQVDRHHGRAPRVTILKGNNESPG